MTMKECANCAHKCVVDNCPSDLMIVCNDWEPDYVFTLLSRERIETGQLSVAMIHAYATEFENLYPNYETYFDGDSKSLKARLI